MDEAFCKDLVCPKASPQLTQGVLGISWQRGRQVFGADVGVSEGGGKVEGGRWGRGYGSTPGYYSLSYTAQL